MPQFQLPLMVASATPTHTSSHSISPSVLGAAIGVGIGAALLAAVVLRFLPIGHCIRHDKQNGAGGRSFTSQPNGDEARVPYPLGRVEQYGNTREVLLFPHEAEQRPYFSGAVPSRQSWTAPSISTQLSLSRSLRNLRDVVNGGTGPTLGNALPTPTTADTPTPASLGHSPHEMSHVGTGMIMNAPQNRDLISQEGEVAEPPPRYYSTVA